MHGGIKFFVSYEESRGRIPGFPDVPYDLCGRQADAQRRFVVFFSAGANLQGPLHDGVVPSGIFLQGPTATGRWLSDFAFFHHFRYLCHILVSPAGKVDQQDGILRHARGHLDGMCQGVG